MNRARIFLLILTMFFSYSGHSILISNGFDIQNSEQNISSLENQNVFVSDTLRQSNALIRRYSHEKDSTGIRYIKKYNYKHFPFFNFRINKKTVYHKLSEFNSERAKELFVLAKNDQFNSDSLTREISLLYTKQGVYSKIDKDLFKRRVHELELRSDELKKSAAKKAKHTKVLEQTADKAPTLILAATHEEVTPAYEGSQNTTKIYEAVVEESQEFDAKEKLVEQGVEPEAQIDISHKEEEAGYLDYEYEYCYQVAVFDKRPTNGFYKGMGFIKEEIVDGGKSFRYLTGSYRTYAKATIYKARIKKAFPASFIVVYKNGIRTNLKDAIAITDKATLNKSSNSTLQLSTEVSGEITYRIQIGVFANGVPDEVNSLMVKYKAFGTSAVEKSNGKTVCTIGHFDSIADAGVLKKKLYESGFTDIFTVAYTGNKRISIHDAIRLIK